MKHSQNGLQFMVLGLQLEVNVFYLSVKTKMTIAKQT
jgi:hypothetical protein